jgi:ATP-dependent DNA helicase RecG
MNQQPASFIKLTKILKHEADMGYSDKAMIGGLAQFADRWQADAQRDGVGAERVRAIVETLRSYSTLPGIDARRQALAQMLEWLSASDAPATQDQSPPLPPASPEEITRSEPTQPARESAPESSVAATDKIETDGDDVEEDDEEESTRGERARRSPSRPPRDHSGQAGSLDAPVIAVSGIGPANAQKLERLGVRTIRDLLYLLPRRYDDFSALKPISKLQPDEEVTVIGTVWEAGLRRTRGGAQIFQAIISDGSGTIQCTWFNPYVKDKIQRGVQIVVSGRIDTYQGRLVFSSPEWERFDKELLHTMRLVPVYPLTEGLSKRWLRRTMHNVVTHWAPRVPDHLPDAIIVSAGLVSLPKAIEQAHFPDSRDRLNTARKRLAFDELFLFSLGMLRQRRQWKSQDGRKLEFDAAWLDRFLNSLPFQMTAAQRRTLDDLLGDIRSGQPMNRLVQGDVGSGKTIVAAAAMFLVTQTGAQAALMAPTEILAEQHFKNFSQVFEAIDPSELPHPIAIRLLTGSTPQSERDQLSPGIAEGRVNIVIGTHALIQEGVAFKDLALVVVDEQHRFGVGQRAALRQKGINPHMLVMTATPIPRTLALTLYGDLDVSTIDELPPGRQPVETRIVYPRERERMYAFVRAQIEKGRQAFIICPLVEESEKIEAKAAVEEHQRLQKQIFPGFKLGLMHGRMKSDEKDEVMRAFAAGELDMLVSTSVVEVGIDVPNATVMLIEGANRFGLSQLHQFRGRVGRGTEKSYCLLLSDSTEDSVNERLRAVESTNDGFVLAEKDLELRGPGEFFGTRQSGMPDMRVSGLADARLIELARREAAKVIEGDALLQAPEHAALAERFSMFWKSGEGDLS